MLEASTMSSCAEEIDRLLARSAVYYQLMETHGEVMSERDFQELTELLDMEIESATSDYD
jgi:hypothetical protein